MSEIIHFFQYLEYDDLESLDLTYTPPSKKNNQIYMAYLNNPIKFYLPKSEIINIFQDDFGNNIARYLINIHDHVEFLTFLENLDSICINHAADNSDLWFNKNLSTNTLVKYYNTLYTLYEDEEENIEEMTVDLEIDNIDLLPLIKEYNNSDELNIIIKIEGIEFFKQTFRWKIIIENIRNGFEDDIDSEDSQLNFNELVSSNKENSLEKSLLNNYADNLPNTVEEGELQVNLNENISVKDENKVINDSESNIRNKTEENSVQESNIQENNIQESNIQESNIQENNVQENNVQESNSVEKNKGDNVSIRVNTNNVDKQSLVSESNVINNDVISELAKTDDNIIDKDSYEKDANKVDTTTMNEIKSLINDKKIQAKKFLLNAERAKRASDSLTKKAEDVSQELSNYEEKLRVMSQNLSL